jgi:hypothetical protein
MMNAQNDPGHGHSPAAWTAVTIMLIAVTVGTVAFFFDLAWLVWASFGVLILGWIIGGVMAKAGYGVKGPRFVPKAHS